MSSFEDDSETEILVVDTAPDGDSKHDGLLDPRTSRALEIKRAEEHDEGLEVARDDHVDLALLVGNFEGVVREDLLEHLETYASEVPVLVVVDDDRPDLEKRLLEHGAIGIVAPEAVEPKTLQTYVRNAVKPHRNSREIRRLERAVGRAQDAVVICDAEADDLPVVYCNKSFERITGYPREETLGRNCRFLQSEETSQERIDQIREALEDEEPFTIEILNARRDGERFWNELSITPVRDERGEVTDYIGFQRDVTRRVEAEREREWYQLAVENIDDIIVVKDREGRFRIANSRAAEILDTTPEEMTGTVDREYLDASTAEQFRRDAEKAIEEDRPVERTVNVDLPGGHYILEVTRIPCRADGEIVGTVGVARDVTEEQMLRRRLEHRLRYDDLTGLANRRLLLDRAERSMERALENDEVVACCMVDLDDFNAVNDTFGRDRGDELIQAVAERLKILADDQQTVARLSGDEFVLLLPDVDDESDIEAFAKDLEETFDEPFPIEEVPVHVPISAGFCFEPASSGASADPEALAKKLCRKAEHAASRAKSIPGNSWRTCDGESETSYDVRIEFENRIRQGLERNEFVPYFQPIYSLSSRCIRAIELLARWHDGERGWISPGQFIPAAEEAGLLQPLTESLLRQAGEITAEIDFPEGWSHPLPLYLNLSPSQVARRNVASRLRGLVDEHVPSKVEVGLEITESQFIERRANIESLRETGFRIIVDDFGTGYSSLTRLKEIPMDELKLDMEFVQSAVETEEDRAILGTAAELGRQLDVDVIGEGVETEEHLSVLEESGCTSAQGYLLGRPGELTDLVANDGAG